MANRLRELKILLALNDLFRQTVENKFSVIAFFVRPAHGLFLDSLLE